ncbi:MAG: hypothetical protein KDB73_17795 [Planctomycetes bacterium]|nr:hypothetical protein [Planctomycetota bacterium]
MLCLIACCGCGGSDTHGWSKAEIENARHFFASTDAHSRVVAASNRGPTYGVVKPSESRAMDALLKTSLSHARQVSDAVLAKAHPDLPAHFRGEYQRSIEVLLESSFQLSGPGIAKQDQALRLHDRWVDWFNANKRSIRFPKD